MDCIFGISVVELVGNNPIRVPVPTFGIARFLPYALLRPSSPTFQGEYIQDLANHRADPNLVSIFEISVIELLRGYIVAQALSKSRRTFFFDQRSSVIWARHCRFPCSVHFCEQARKRNHGSVCVLFKFLLSQLCSHF